MRRKPRPIALLAMLLIAVPAAGAAPDGGADPVAAMQAVYEQTKSFSASFKQVYTPKGLPHKQRSQGRVYFAIPGKMRWAYEKPEEKLFVADGNNLYFYKPAENQVLVTRDIDQKLSTALAFLFGRGRLRDDFQIQRLEKSRYGREGEVVLELTPKEDEGHARKLYMVLDPETWLVRETVVIDALGNKNHIRFSDIELNPKLDDELFEFEPPDGVEVVRPPGQ